jgi:hypothetical protein
VRKAFLVLGIVAALATAGGASAAKPPGPAQPQVICTGSCDNGGTGGYSGCTSQEASHSTGIQFLASVRHFLVVNYCKSNGVITRLSIAGHGCDSSGLMSCTTGPAWQTGGGVGSGYATFEAHAQWWVSSNPFYVSYDVLTLTIPVG